LLGHKRRLLSTLYLVLLGLALLHRRRLFACLRRVLLAARVAVVLSLVVVKVRLERL